LRDAKAPELAPPVRLVKRYFIEEVLLHEIWNINFIFRDELFKCNALAW